ncbi:MAG TPA: hypothetical protein VGS27_00635 [Candidatus Sulfotelmatobacter sp.]|nr:hypothetical protein [Candidatus Sulfotelmatobacter sp.]
MFQRLLALFCAPILSLAAIAQSTGTAPGSPVLIENSEANHHLQPWMVDGTLPIQLAAYSKTWSVIIARLQHDFRDTTIPFAERSKLLLPNVDHVELALPGYEQSVVIETKYYAQKGGWVFRLIRGLKGDQSRADLLAFGPRSWSLQREEPRENIGSGKIAAMPKVIDFPIDENVEAQSTAKHQGKPPH